MADIASFPPGGSGKVCDSSTRQSEGARSPVALAKYLFVVSIDVMPTRELLTRSTTPSTSPILRYRVR